MAIGFQQLSIQNTSWNTTRVKDDNQKHKWASQGQTEMNLVPVEHLFPKGGPTCSLKQASSIKHSWEHVGNQPGLMTANWRPCLLSAKNRALVSHYVPDLTDFSPYQLQLETSKYTDSNNHQLMIQFTVTVISTGLKIDISGLQSNLLEHHLSIP